MRGSTDAAHMTAMDTQMLRRNQTGAGRTVNSAGHVVSGGAFASHQREGDSIGALQHSGRSEVWEKPVEVDVTLKHWSSGQTRRVSMDLKPLLDEQDLDHADNSNEFFAYGTIGREMEESDLFDIEDGWGISNVDLHPTGYQSSEDPIAAYITSRNNAGQFEPIPTVEPTTLTAAQQPPAAYSAPLGNAVHDQPIRATVLTPRGFAGAMEPSPVDLKQTLDMFDLDGVASFRSTDELREAFTDVGVPGFDGVSFANDAAVLADVNRYIASRNAAGLTDPLV